MIFEDVTVDYYRLDIDLLIPLGDLRGWYGGGYFVLIWYSRGPALRLYAYLTFDGQF
jgi:hypothetical protein